MNSAQSEPQRQNEAAVLGSLLMDAERVYPLLLDRGINPEHFTTAGHRAVWEASARAIADGKVPDIVTAGAYLDASGLKAIGGQTGIDALVDACIPSHVGYHADHLREAWVRRRVKATAASVAGAGDDRPTQDLIAELQGVALAVTAKGRSMTPRQVEAYRADKVAQWAEAKGRGFIGIPSAFPSVNKWMGGYRRNTVTVLGGYRGCGKSTLARQEAMSAATAGYKVLLVTIEDPGDTAAAGMAGNLADVSVFHLDVGESSDFQRQRIDESWQSMAALPLWLCDCANTMPEIVAAATFHAAREGCDLIILDHLQFISPYKLPQTDRNGTVATYMQAGVQLVKRIGCAGLFLSQLSRESEKEDRKPRLSDLRDSGAIEQDARAALLLYWDRELGHHVLAIAKNNHGPSNHDIEIERQDGHQRFRELTGNTA